MAEWLRAVISFGSGVAGLSVPYPHPHTTHDSILTLSVHPSHAERSAVHPRAEAAVCFSYTAGLQPSRRWSVSCSRAGSWSVHSSHGSRCLFFPTQRGGSLAHPHAQAEDLLDLTRLEGELLTCGHSRFPQSGIG